MHPDMELRSDHLQLGDTREDEHRLHRYREVAIPLKHSGDPLGLRPALACVGRRVPVRCSPNRMTSIAKAILTLERQR
ncbi:hypothetical protein GCM10014715_41260 [Streptomyces spiralis]|uniref:Uncharacterized protein n=1 Tax=Streptomyces spiralis TaxID=66376 RepID=A0A919DSX1_9ACTN|nr:hypothetical protein GCM10014715_41260 [Streptomyces spiralis]